MTSVQSRSRVGRVGDVAVNRVGHLVTEDGELVQLHQSLVLSVNALVSQETSGSDLSCKLAFASPALHKQTYHVGGHAITNEEDDVLGLSLRLERANSPLGSGLLAVVVVQSNGVLAGLVEGDLAVDLGGNVDNTGLVLVLGKKVLVPVELPCLDLGLLEAECLCKVLGLLTLLGNGHLELLVRLAIVGSLRAVDGSVNLDTEIEELAGEEVTLVWGQNATERRTCAQTLVGLRRGSSN